MLSNYLHTIQYICYLGRPGGYGYHGYGGPPPPPGHPPGHPPHMYPGPPGVMYYPVHPAYFYPYPPPPHADPVQVVDSPPEDVGPELPGETVELPWSKSRSAIILSQETTRK